MPKVLLWNQRGEKVGEIDLADRIFSVEVKPYIIYEVVKWQLAKRRAGTASTKTRGEVRGGGRKPWRQKGTGRARVGSIRSPLWKGGGVIFGPRPKSYAYALPKKIRKQAIKMTLTSKLKSNKLMIVDDISLDVIKTKKFLEIMDNLRLKKALIVTDGREPQLELSARNVPNFQIMPTEGLNAYDILRYEHLVLLKEAILKIEEALK